MPAGVRKWTLIVVAGAAIWLVAGVVTVWLHFSAKPPAQLLGDEFRDARLKLSFRPPAGWKLSTMPQELARGAIVGQPLLAEYFDGLLPGEFCTLVVVESDQPLEAIAQQALRNRPPAAAMRDQTGKFFELNGLEAWGCEWVIKQQAVVHQLNVVLRRGSLRVSITYAAPQSSYRRQQPAITESLKSLTFW
jgi:hypothetical protein